MDTLIHADIFFFVTTVAVVVVGIVFTVALIYLIKILNDIKKISEQIREETILFREDISDLRNETRRGGFKVKNFIEFATGLFRWGKSTRSKTSQKNK